MTVQYVRDSSCIPSFVSNKDVYLLDTHKISLSQPKPFRMVITNPGPLSIPVKIKNISHEACICMTSGSMLAEQESVKPSVSAESQRLRSLSFVQALQECSCICYFNGIIGRGASILNSLSHSFHITCPNYDDHILTEIRPKNVHESWFILRGSSIEEELIRVINSTKKRRKKKKLELDSLPNLIYNSDKSSNMISYTLETPHQKMIVKNMIQRVNESVEIRNGVGSSPWILGRTRLSEISFVSTASTSQDEIYDLDASVITLPTNSSLVPPYRFVINPTLAILNNNSSKYVGNLLLPASCGCIATYQQSSNSISLYSCLSEVLQSLPSNRSVVDLISKANLVRSELVANKLDQGTVFNVVFRINFKIYFFFLAFRDIGTFRNMWTKAFPSSSSTTSLRSCFGNLCLPSSLMIVSLPFSIQSLFVPSLQIVSPLQLTPERYFLRFPVSRYNQVK
jgi:hypothetical protein